MDIKRSSKLDLQLQQLQMSNHVLSPSDFDPHAVTTPRFDFVDSMEKYEDDPKNWLVITPVRHDRRVFRIGIKGELSTDGINVGKFESGESHSIGVLFTDSADMVLYKKLYELETLLFGMLPSDWSTTNVKESDVLYLKLKQRDGKYRAQSDIRWDPKEPKKSGLSRNQPVDIQVEIQLYFNYKEKKAGIYLDLVSLKTKTDEPVKRRKRD